jgi:DNA-directed RNA polymerase subunit RPC12/RpoP
MGLTTCPDCKNEVSTNAVACPKCGSPIATKATDKSFDEFVKQIKDEKQAPIDRSTIQLTSKNLKNAVSRLVRFVLGRVYNWIYQL